MNNNVDLPLVTIIVPVYNVEPYLRQCLDSVVGQTYTNLEILLIDDGSTDGSADIIDEYALRDSRIRTIHQPNAGLSAARNTGLRLMTGKLVTMVDSDDCIAPQLVEILQQTLVREDADIAVAAWTRFDDTPPTFQPDDTPPRVYSADQAINAVFYQHRLTNSVCSRLFKAELFHDVRFPDGMLYEDLAVAYPLLKNVERVAYHHAVTYYYRRRATSILGQFTPERVHVLDILDDLERQMAQEAPQYLPAVRSRQLSAFFNIYLLSCDQPQHADTAQRCWKGIKRLRFGRLFDKHVRMKNRIGIVLSLFGPWAVKLLKHLK